MSVDTITVNALIILILIITVATGIMIKEFDKNNEIWFESELDNQDINIILTLNKEFNINQNFKNKLSNELFKLTYNSKFTLEELRRKIREELNQYIYNNYDKNKKIKIIEVKIIAK